LCVLVLLVNVALPVAARRRYLQQEARRMRREKRT
ncbi:heme exporter protein CcmD, partial [Pseudomonas viridiflava]